MKTADMTTEDRDVRVRLFGLKAWKTASNLRAADVRDARIMSTLATTNCRSRHVQMASFGISPDELRG